MYRVKDGNRTIEFEGELLASSSSWRRDSTRWVEFELYKTQGGSYVLSRIGRSSLFHDPECSLVRKYSLPDSPRVELDPRAVPCPECRPDLNNFPMVCNEKTRYWGQVSEKPSAVLDALQKVDDYGNIYLTLVARRLLEKAADVDEDIGNTYRIERVE